MAAILRSLGAEQLQWLSTGRTSCLISGPVDGLTKNNKLRGALRLLAQADQRGLCTCCSMSCPTSGHRLQLADIERVREKRTLWREIEDIYIEGYC